MPLALEEALSSAFVDIPEYTYGTRCSTLLLASAQDGHAAAGRWDVRLEERTHRHEGLDTSSTGSASPATSPLHVSDYRVFWAANTR